MAPNKQRNASRKEFRAEHSRQPARQASRKLPPRRLHDIGDASISAASHGEDPSIERDTAPPREDRAG